MRGVVNGLPTTTDGPSFGPDFIFFSHEWSMRAVRQGTSRFPDKAGWLS